MMHVNMADNLPSGKTEIITLVTDNDLFTRIIPLIAMIEFLIQIPRIAEQLFSDLSV